MEHECDDAEFEGASSLLLKIKQASGTQAQISLPVMSWLQQVLQRAAMELLSVIHSDKHLIGCAIHLPPLRLVGADISKSAKIADLRLARFRYQL